MKVPSEAQTPQGHPPGAALSQQYNMEVCSQDHSERCLGFFLAYVPQRLKLQNRIAKGELAPTERNRYKN